MMVLVKFENPVRAEDGSTWRAQVCGRKAGENIWEGWLEFEPTGGGEPVRSPRETTQPNLPDLEYWASGLTVAYLEGALERALDPAPEAHVKVAHAATPAFTRPASPRHGPDAAGAHAVLNPMEVYRQGEHVLREELGALDDGHLHNIVRAYDIVGDVDPTTMGRNSLIEAIVDAAQRGG